MVRIVWKIIPFFTEIIVFGIPPRNTVFGAKFSVIQNGGVKGLYSQQQTPEKVLEEIGGFVN